jgi:oligopeptide transport system substrate-binding protein
MTRRVAAIGVLALLISLAGCGQHSTPYSTLRRGLRGDVSTLDPQKAGDEFSEEVLRDLYEGLTTEGDGGRALPALAASWSVSDDGLTYTFRLRAEARWSNGNPVVAQDVLRGLRRALDPKTASPNAAVLRPIENAAEILAGATAPETLGVWAPDPRSLVIRLRHPTPYLPVLLARPVAYPVHGPTLTQYGDHFAAPGRLVSNGPYRLEAVSPGTSILVSRNEHYWNRDRVAIEKVEFLPFPDSHAELNRYRAHDLDVTSTLPANQFEWARKTLASELQFRPQLATVFVAFNLTSTPLQNAGIREALTLVLDREALTENVLRAGQVPAYSFVPPGMPDYTPASYAWRNASREARLKRARSLYTASGFSAANPLRIRLMFSPNEALRNTALTSAAAWKEVLGVEVQLDEREFKTFLAMRSERSQWDAIVDGWGADFADPVSFLDVLRSRGPNNDSGWADAEFDRLLDVAEAEPTAAGRFRALQDAERRLLGSYAVAPIFHPVLRRLVSPSVGDATLSPMAHQYSQRLRWIPNSSARQ